MADEAEQLVRSALLHSDDAQVRPAPATQCLTLAEIAAILDTLTVQDRVRVIWRDRGASEWTTWTAVVTHTDPETWVIYDQKAGYFVPIPDEPFEYKVLEKLAQPRVKAVTAPPSAPKVPPPKPAPKASAPKALPRPQQPQQPQQQLPIGDPDEFCTKIAVAVATAMQSVQRANTHEREDDEEDRHNPVIGHDRISRALKWGSGNRPEMSAAAAVGKLSSSDFIMKLEFWQNEIRSLSPQSVTGRTAQDIARVLSVAPVLFRMAHGMVVEKAPDNVLEDVLKTLQLEINTLHYAHIRAACPSKTGEAVSYFDATLRTEKRKELRNSKFTVEYENILEDAIAKFSGPGNFRGRPSGRPGRPAYKGAQHTPPHPPTTSAGKKMQQ